MSMTHEFLPRTPRYKNIAAQGSRRIERSRQDIRPRQQGRQRPVPAPTSSAATKHGQTPIFRVFPKRGFSNFDFERRFYIVNLTGH